MSGGAPSSNSLSAPASLIDLLETSSCIHTTEPDNKALLDYIIAKIRPMLPTAISATVQPESWETLVTGVDGSGAPITCRDGRPSLAADRYFRQWHFTVLSPGPDASLKHVEVAMCYDVRHGAPECPDGRRRGIARESRTRLALFPTS